MKQKDRKLVLEDGSVYTGYGFGYPADRVCEIVFNTSMVGYQEIVSDLSYTDQAVVMTYPLIGNYGVTDDDFECLLLRQQPSHDYMQRQLCHQRWHTGKVGFELMAEHRR